MTSTVLLSLLLVALRRGFLVLAVTAVFAVLGALSDTLDILDFWQRRTQVPPGGDLEPVLVLARDAARRFAA